MSKIFVSAASKELGDVRKAVAVCLKDKRHKVIEQDELAPHFSTTEDKLEADIKKCDSVICLAGITSGSLIPSKRLGPIGKAHLKSCGITGSSAGLS